MSAIVIPGWRSFSAMAGVLLVTVSVTAWSPANPERSPTAPADLVLSAQEEDCSAECSDDGCFPTQHYYMTYGVHEGWIDEGFGSSHPCETGSCGHHDECEPQKEEADLEVLDLALQTLEGENLKRLLDRNPERLFWNASRSSVQLMGCGARVQMSIRLTVSQADALSK